VFFSGHHQKEIPPLFTITRRLAGQVRAVCRRAFGSTRSFGPAIWLATSSAGLCIRSKFADAAVEYRGEGGGSDEHLWLPFHALLDFEGKKDEPVQLEAQADGRVTAQWTDRGVPQLIQYEVIEPADASGFPSLPETLIDNSATILDALHAASESTDLDSVRFALGHIQFRGGSGTLAATDGRQLLVEDGFQFPWDGDILVPRSKAFTSPEFPRDQPLAIGRTEDWVALRSGPWTLWSVINKDGRFPNLDNHLARPEDATTHCQISSADAEFLTKTLPRLPADDEWNDPVTLDLDGSVTIRAKAQRQPRPTEAILSSSSWSGESVRINTNRKFLARAVKLGLHGLRIYGPKTPVLCQDQHRRYAWALLDPESAIGPADDAIRIVSSEANPDTPVTQSQPRRKASPVTEPVTNPKGNTASNGQADGPVRTSRQAKVNGQARNGVARKPGQDIDGLIRQAETLRASLRDALLKNNELLKSLKAYRRRNRALQNTLASLRQLKTLGV
jgi:hypothetical protein